MTYTKFLTIGVLCASLCFLSASCGDNGGKDTEKDSDSTLVVDNQADKELSRLVGRLAAYDMTDMWNTAHKGDSAANFSDYKTGIATAIDTRHSMAYVSGLSYATMLYGDFKGFEDGNYPIARRELLELIEKNIKPGEAINEAESNRLRELHESLRDKIAEVPEGEDLTAVKDSLQNVYAQLVGMALTRDLLNYQQSEAKEYNIVDLKAGIRKVLGENVSSDFIEGVYNSTILAQNILVIEHQGVTIDNETVLNELLDVMKSPDIDLSERDALLEKFNAYMDNLEKGRLEKEEQAAATSDKAIQNIKTGEALVAKIKKEHPEAKTTESGLTYIIYNPGVGEKIKNTNQVSVNYKGMHLDNKEFDSGDSVIFSPESVIPGFAEGLRMLGKGGKATFWIPGELAYGGQGIPQAGIGPMETLVFDVEIVDIIQ